MRSTEAEELSASYALEYEEAAAPSSEVICSMNVDVSMEKDDSCAELEMRTVVAEARNVESSASRLLMEDTGHMLSSRLVGEPEERHHTVGARVLVPRLTPLGVCLGAVLL